LGSNLDSSTFASIIPAAYNLFIRKIMPSIVMKEMIKHPNQKKDVSGKVQALLGIMGIAGLILIIFGVFALFEVSTLVGSISLSLGVLDYIVFVLIEKKLKIL